ncbi:GNAT family N-acetyltransferase [Kocuria sp. HSID16901]|uniref:GNAT family N-acetyltransferase n=1 Tax=Kocuria sp. HSID16901 TaxID=2419505 RepID=UPI00065FA634|nr:GNAT family N-acetyltransferase [Kocuria sp. HSID16901]MCT1367409.1 N-acetyltransferase family protein [Rothia sp. p3-SID1597]RUQ22496.1 N-acetyltransferase [Kocuria sp. HSID16901]
MNSVIRRAAKADAEACASIYRPYVENTDITFETVAPSSADMEERIASALETHEWLILEDDGEVAGYAYAGTFNPRASYQWACEASVYMDGARRSNGGGTRLYTELLNRLRQKGFRRVMGGVTQPNDASNRLHQKFGFELIGTYTKVGWKNGAWHDVSWYELDLCPDDHRDTDPGLPPTN